MDPALWGAAAEEQKDRTTEDPYFEMLADQLEDEQGKITTDSLWEIIGERSSDARTQEKSARITEAMRRLGWKKPNNRTINAKGKKVSGFVKGPDPWTLIKPKM